MRSIDLDTLEIFRTVVAEGGVIRAAEQAEPRAVERHDAHQAARSSGWAARCSASRAAALVLSPEGELLLSYAQRLFRLADEAESELRSGPPMGVLRIGSLESTAGSRLAPMLSRYHR